MTDLANAERVLAAIKQRNAAARRAAIAQIATYQSAALNRRVTIPND